MNTQYTQYHNGYHCPRCLRKLWTTRRAPRCCGRVMVNDYQPGKIVSVQNPPASQRAG